MSIYTGVATRLKILSYFLTNRQVRTRTRFKEVINHLFSPKCEAISLKYVEPVKNTDKYNYYKIKGFDRIFPYPASAPYHNFAQVIAEGMLPNHWHHYEIEQTKVSTGDVIVDCGSAEGFFAFKYQDVAKRIYCIEPLPLFVEVLKEMFADKENVEILPYALGSKPGTLYMEMGESAIASTCNDSPEGMKNYITVKAFTIDNLFSEKNIKIDYLKADLEGFEEEMIRGALETIRTSKPKIAITTYHAGQDPDKLIELVRGVVPEYKFLKKGIEHRVGNPVMLHMWI
jgi:FkbM family methyltransferase